MSTIRFPSGPIIDMQTGEMSLEWNQWFQNPQVVSLIIETAIDPTSGGTGLTSYTTGDLIYASATDVLANLADVATGNALISGGVATAPSWGKIALTTHVSGVLPAANGGVPTLTDGQLVVGQTAANPLAKTVSGYGTMAATGALTVSKVLGTSTNDSATAGDVGEYVSSSIANASAVALTTDTPADITSISLTAGDWDVWIDGYFKGNAATTVGYLYNSISLTTATLDATNGRIGGIGHANGALFASTAYSGIVAGPVRISTASTITVYMVAQAGFAINTCSGYGIIQARRRR